MADTLDTLYSNQRRGGAAESALNELLSQFGMDENLQPIQEQQPGQAQGLGKIQFDSSVSPEERAMIEQRLGVTASGAPQARMSQADAATRSAQRITQQQQLMKQEAKQAPSFMGDVVGGTLKEVPRAIVSGATSGVKEMLGAADSLANFINEQLGTSKGGAFGKAKEAIPEFAADPTTPGGKLIAGITQFATGYATGGKLLKGAGVVGQTAKMLGAGAFSDLAAFNPNDPNLSNIANDLFQNPISEFLSTNPNDSEAVNRLKRAVEGAGLSVATEAGIKLVKLAVAARADRKVNAAFKKAQEVKAAEPPPAAVEPDILQPAAPPSAASQVDIVQPLAGQDIGLGISGREGTMVSPRLMLPAPGQATKTADEIAENAIKEIRAQRAIEGNPTLNAAAEAMAIKNEVVGNPMLRAAYETTLRGQSEEDIISAMVKKAKPELEAIAKEALNEADVSAEVLARGRAFLAGGGDLPVSTLTSEPLDVGAEVMARGRAFLNEKGEVSPQVLSTIARAAIGGALGLTQGDTMEERITNGLIAAGVGAALKPSLIKKLISGFERVAPREAQIVKSFDPPVAGVTKKGIPRVKSVGAVNIASDADTKAFLAADPSAIQVGSKAIKIKWDEIGDQQGINDVIKTVTNLFEGQIDEARRGVQTVEHQNQLANMLGMTYEDVVKRRRGQALNAEQSRAYIAVWGDALKETDRLAQALKAGQPVEAQLRIQLGRTTAITEQMFGARAEAGRALPVWGAAAQQLKSGGQLQRDIALLKISGASIDDVPAEKLADMILKLRDPAQKSTFLIDATRMGKSALLEAWMNGLLSNTVTHASNIISNATTTGIGLVERAVAPMFGKDIARGEAGAMLTGIAGGWQDALMAAKKAFQTGESQLGFSKMEIHGRAITAENLGVTGAMGRAVDLIGAGVSSPGRALLAADDFFKAINYRAELHAQSFRQAASEGLTGGALKKRIAELVADTDFKSLVKDQAENFAAYMTFNNQLGAFGQGYIRLMEDHPWMRLVTPFVRTPVNIGKFTLERTPLVNLLVKNVREDLMAGGARQQMALAKTAFGAMMYTTAATLALGGYVTGGGPLNADLRNIKRQTGWQPYSFHIGDEYISYKRIDPIGFFFGFAADFVEKAGELSEPTLNNLAMAGVVSTKDVFMDKTYLQGVQDVMEAVNDQNGKFINSYFNRLAGNIVPAGIAQIARMMSPTIKEINSASDAIFSRLPGFGGDLQPRRNLWGEPIELEGAIGPDLVSPFYSNKQKDDPVSDEMLRLESAVSMPPNYIYGTRPTESPFANEDARRGIKLLPEEYGRYVELAGKPAHEKLLEVIKSESYLRMSEADKKTIIERYIDVYRREAQVKLIEEFPDLKEAMGEKIQQRIQSHAPEGAMPFSLQ